MRYLRLVLVALCFLPYTLSAETVLYVCTQNGETTLQSTPSKECDTLQEYHYPSYNKAQKPSTINGLRTEEIKQLQAQEGPQINPQSITSRYENIDERVGWALSEEYRDARQEKCAFYRAKLNNALYFIATQNQQLIDIGPVHSAELLVQIQQAQSQVDYYCSR